MPIKTAQKFKTTPAGEIPVDWECYPLQEVLETIESGMRPKGGVSVDSGEVPSFGGENIKSDGGVTYEDVNKVTMGFFKSMPKGILKNRDVLINKDGAWTGKVGLYNSTTYATACINEHLFILRGKNGCITQEFIYYLLLSEEGEKKLRRIITGSAQPGLGTSFPKFFPAQVPPLAEQKKIAAILCSVDETINKIQGTIEQIQVLKKSLMQELFTQRLPGKHKKMPIRDLLLFCQYGLNKPLTRDPSGVAVLRMGNLAEGRVVTNSLKYSELTSAEEKEYLLKDGDVLFNRTNSREMVGKVALFEGKAKIAFASYLLRLRVNPEKANPAWLNYYLNSPLMQIQLRSLATPGVSQSNINAQAMQAIRLNVPDVKIQEESVGLLQSLDERIKNETAQKIMLQNIKLSLAQVLLTGKVRVKA